TPRSVTTMLVIVIFGAVLVLVVATLAVGFLGDIVVSREAHTLTIAEGRKRTSRWYDSTQMYIGYGSDNRGSSTSHALEDHEQLTDRPYERLIWHNSYTTVELGNAL
ncbi:hypothetical protein EV182_002192, partial [Spiromyces aspiralis]